MKLLTSLLVLALFSLPVAAKQNCAAHATVTVTPPVAAPGVPITVTITNTSATETITLPTLCVYQSIYVGTTCSGQHATAVFCAQAQRDLAPGESWIQVWDQKDACGAQVSPGDYSFDVKYADSGGAQYSCCPTVTILPVTCGTKAVVTVSSPVAPQGMPIAVTITNVSSETIKLPDTCVFRGVYDNATCTSPSIYSSTCFMALTPIPPGGSWTQLWSQKDNGGSQVSAGVYSFKVTYWDDAVTTLEQCCQTVTIVNTLDSCGPLATVTVKPPVANAGDSVEVEITNTSSAPIYLPTQCVFEAVLGGISCVGVPVFVPICLQAHKQINPGQSEKMAWDQKDESGIQVPGGPYSFVVRYWDSTRTVLHACCPTVFINSFPQGIYPYTETYCMSGTSASGCQTLVHACGQASASASSGFVLEGRQASGVRTGLFFFGTNGRQANPWGSGTSFQCVAPPVQRAGILTSSGTPGLCDGLFTQDLNALWCPTCSKPLKNPGAGAVVQAQLWYRDPLNTSNQTTSLSNAIEFLVGP